MPRGTPAGAKRGPYQRFSKTERDVVFRHLLVEAFVNWINRQYGTHEYYNVTDEGLFFVLSELFRPGKILRAYDNRYRRELNVFFVVDKIHTKIGSKADFKWQRFPEMWKLLKMMRVERKLINSPLKIAPTLFPTCSSWEQAASFVSSSRQLTPFLRTETKTKVKLAQDGGEVKRSKFVLHYAYEVDFPEPSDWLLG